MEIYGTDTLLNIFVPRGDMTHKSSIIELNHNDGTERIRATNGKHLRARNLSRIFA